VTSPKSPRHPTPGRGSLPKAKSGPAVPLGIRIAPDLHAWVKSQPGTQRETVEAGLRLLWERQEARGFVVTASPLWTVITHDPATWPDDSLWMLVVEHELCAADQLALIREDPAVWTGVRWRIAAALPETPEGGNHE